MSRQVKVSIKYNELITIEIMDIFFSFLTSFKYEGKKYKIPMLPNEYKFPIPEIKVLSTPYPSIGKIFCGTRFLVFASKIKIIPNNAIGKIIIFALITALSPSFATTPIVIIKIAKI